MSPQRPRAATAAIWLTVGVMVINGVTALLTLVLEQQLVDDWASERTDASAVEPPAFAPVAITMFVVVAVLTLVLLMFFREGHEWSRILLSAISVLLAVATIAALRSTPPAVFLLLSAISLVVDVAAAITLWHPETRTFTRRTPVAVDA
jgi:hypothetical protein